ncbi:hypothetical protein EHQ58_01180 [Leptospira ognonensis]|uniref:ChsH2 C-terminal OB-fold domain-containing protein n=1 Tax=Leptospira ognonensis TaxID=2484945 RepID=A0A4R9KD65_9LEPT|nr:OB-fold domain-containing protein [Leptospira ognonensis]TGL63093.1 hypothetical protein EHQ58_01180 [Leptospira ognonensis]
MKPGKVYTYTIVYVGFGHMAERAPYVLAIIDFPDHQKITAVIEDVTDFSQIKIGVTVQFKRVDEKIGSIYSL